MKSHFEMYKVLSFLKETNKLQIDNNISVLVMYIFLSKALYVSCLVITCFIVEL